MRVLTWVALIATAILTLEAQTSTATLSGVIVDPQDSVIPSVTVTLIDPARGLERKAVANASGAFLFPQLAPSTYEILVDHSGFQKSRLTGLVMNADDQRAVRIRLLVAQRDETVVVNDEAPLVRESPSVATSVDRKFIENQPLNGRSFQSLIQLSPGVVVTAASLASQGQFSVNGQRPGANAFSVDGVSANFGLPSATSTYEGAGGSVPSFSAQGGTSSLASVDAVQEFTIQTSTYAPEYGRQPGAQVAIVTRSGTNVLHGSAFNYFRNDKLDANSWFGNFNGIKRPALRQNDFGFTVGGPLLIPKLYDGRNRTFFFVSYEGLRLIQPVVLTGARVPSLAARQNATGAVKSLLEAYPLPVAAPFADAPLETPYTAGFSNPSTLNATSFRLDHSLSSRVTVFGRFNYAPSEGQERARYATASFIAKLPNETKTLTLGSTAVLSPSLNNDLRFNYSQSMAAQIYVQDTFGGAKLLSNDILFPGFTDPSKALYYLTIGGNDENTISPGTFSRNTQRQINIVDTVSWNQGTHALKFGVDYRRLAPTIGGREYGKTLSVPTLTQLATGIVPSATITQIPGFLEPRYQNFSAFAQDAWRVAPRLTLTYGLRWDLNPAPSNTAARTVTGIENPSSATLAPVGTPFYGTLKKNFAPRIGVAYQPLSHRGTVIRAGFGIFYDLGYTLLGTALSPTLYPFARSRTVANTPIQDAVFFAEVPPLNTNPPYPRLFSFYRDYAAPRTYQYSLAIEHPLGGSNALSLSYVGAAGRNLGRMESLLPAVLQNPNFTRIDAVSSTAYSDYNSLQAQFKRRMTRGLQALLSYTWSKSLDTSSDESTSNFLPPNTRYSVATDRGPSSFDSRHTFSGSASYEIPAPFSNRAAKALLGGFALDSIVRLRSALPVLVVTGRDALGLGITSVSRPDYVAGQPLYLFGDGYPGGRIFNRNAFDATTPQAQGRQGTLGRNVLRGFNLHQVDLSIRRRFRLTETVGLDFRADAFNLLNTPNFGNPTGVMTSTNFGRSTAILSTGVTGGQNPQFQVGGPRSLQLALRVQF
ncbi:TonB-dependent receptor [Bryobacter aggregatus]|uniref:TonB-dependent receptor n=1 Tax=Bryobacter aggregatus TaxID=360054 RepID=UPI0004E12F46|nr:TonB-dependent receptor [Bryobacter aggregatus]